jgi:uncharacterized protein YndB with AHSA1/START domain
MKAILDHNHIVGALGDATRRDIVRRAIEGEEEMAELAEHDSMTFAAVQKHMAILERAGLISKHRIGRSKVVDPRQLECWWGPTTYPATVDTHNLRHGGRVQYHMTGPEGDQPRGYWNVDVVQLPYRLVFSDGFANEDGTPNTESPMTTVRVTIQDISGGKTRMSIESEIPTAEVMEQLEAVVWRRARRRPWARPMRSSPRIRRRKNDGGIARGLHNLT